MNGWLMSSATWRGASAAVVGGVMMVVRLPALSLYTSVVVSGVTPANVSTTSLPAICSCVRPAKKRTTFLASLVTR